MMRKQKDILFAYRYLLNGLPISTPIESERILETPILANAAEV